MSTTTEPTTDALVASFDSILSDDQAARAEYTRVSGELAALLAGFEARARDAAEIRAQLLRRQQEGRVDGRGWPGQAWDGRLVHAYCVVRPFQINDPSWGR